MARASEASKEQIKVMGTKEQNSENPSVNEIRYGDKQKQSSSRRPGSSSGSQKKKCKLWFFSPVGILSCLWQNMQLLPEERPFRECLPKKNARFWRENCTCRGRVGW